MMKLIYQQQVSYKKLLKIRKECLDKDCNRRVLKSINKEIGCINILIDWIHYILINWIHNYIN